ncbi:MAG: V-type ATP synthase subunit A [Candidatus Acidifodinimicrobium sp.]
MGQIYRISGPLIEAVGVDDARMNDLVKIGERGIIGEIIKLDKERIVVQAYEDTTGVKVGEKITSTREPLTAELGPGLIGSIFDGVQRPLDKIFEKEGVFIKSGTSAISLDRKKKWNFIPTKKNGDTVKEGDEIGYVKESSVINHKILVPPGYNGKIKEIKKGEFSVEETVAIIQQEGLSNSEIKMIQRWPVRKARKTLQKLPPDTPLVTGQRVIDTLFPMAKGGTAAIPGAFGTGKTVVEHEIAKWSDADIIVYVGCGERGNEMSEVLTTFPELKDPRTGRSLMERTVLIANTSNMPVIAREASIYTGVTIAEYYRDMGYSVALLADSTSRWAEALREISGRLEEMPGEEGYPSYLSKRIAEFYERAGVVKTLGNRIGSLSIIGAVSPPGGDISEPVSQSTLRATRVFWSLDAHLANSRHFPSINWLSSYSLYTPLLDDWYKKNLPADWISIREEMKSILQNEAEINELVQLVGYDALSEMDKLIVKTGKTIREDFLQQNAFDEVDTYCSLNKQYKILKAIIDLHNKEAGLISKGTHINQIKSEEADDKIAKMKYVGESEIDRYFIETMKAISTIGEGV